MKKVLFLLLILFLLTTRGIYAAGPLLKFVPTSKTYTPGQDFEVTLAVDSGTVKTAAIDAWVTFDSAQAEIIGIRAVSNPPFPFQIYQNIHNDTGKFDISFNSTNSSSFDTTTAIGDLAIITVRPKSNGTINLTFMCTQGSTIDSNIFDLDSKDTIDCASNQNGVYTAGGTSSNPTATPTSSTSNPAPTAAQLPKTGSIENTAILGILGIVAIIGSFVLRFL